MSVKTVPTLLLALLTTTMSFTYTTGLKPRPRVCLSVCLSLCLSMHSLGCVSCFSLVTGRHSGTHSQLLLRKAFTSFPAMAFQSVKLTAAS